MSERLEMDESSPPDGYSFLRSSSSNSSNSKGHNSTAPSGDAAIVGASPEGMGLQSPAMRQAVLSPNASSAEMGLAMGNSEAPAKRKRGRPRKYGDSKSTTLSLTTSGSAGLGSGSAKQQQLAALGGAGQDFTPHVIIIAPGEDVAAKIMAFAHVGPRTVCVISANGAISNATLRQPAMSGGTVTYEGRFEILSLSGSFLLNDTGGSRTRTGGLSVSLAGPDGRVVGGGVAGLLVAASQVQVVAGSFIADDRESSGTLLDTDFYIGEQYATQFFPEGGFGASTSRTESSSLSVNDNGIGAASRLLGSQCPAHGNLRNWQRGSTDINLPLPGGSTA